MLGIEVKCPSFMLPLEHGVLSLSLLSQNKKVGVLAHGFLGFGPERKLTIT